MLSAAIYSIVNVPAKPPTPSSRSLQWTPDGQLLVLGESTIYLLTPGTGFGLSAGRPVTAKSNRGMKWLTTLLPLQATELFWPEVSQGWGSLCIGAVEYTWNAVTYSPTGCSNVGSCLLATLSSNLEVYLWAPKDNFYCGEWAKIQDITRDILAQPLNQNMPTEQSTLNAQVQALCWSSHPPALPQTHHMSLLALGTRAGTVLFLRLQEGKMKVVASVTVADAWIVALAWTKWTAGDDGRSVNAKLACALPSGRIVLLDVFQSSDSSSYTADSVPVVTVAGDAPFREDRRGITSMEWVSIDSQEGEESSVLVHCKAGTVEIWRKERQLPTRVRWSGLRSFSLTLESTSTASTNLAQAAGIIYVPQHDVLIISLMDGSHHTIHQLSENPTLVSQSDDPSVCTSASLSSDARSAFLVSEFHEREIPKDGSEPAKIYHNHVARTTGAVAVDSGGVVLWIHQKIFSESFEYIPDARIRCLLVAAPLIMPSNYDQYAIKDLNRCLEGPNNFLLASPIAILRGSYVHLGRKDFIQRNRGTIVSLLSPLPISATLHHADALMEEDFVTSGEEWTVQASEKLSSALFADEILCRERLKLNMAMICNIHYPNAAFEKLIQALREAIYAASLLNTFDWLKRLPSTVVQESGSFFASRMLRQARLSSVIESGNPSIKAVSDMFREEVDDSEECPACGGSIEFTDVSLGKCEDGHYWSRCSTTSYILPTPDVRSCVCCGSKVMLPLDLDSMREGSDTQKDELLARVVLTSIQNCRMCGNKCVQNEIEH